MANDSGPDQAAVFEAVRRQAEVADDHDLGLIQESLRLTPDQRLQRLTRWVAFISSARRISGPAQGGRA
jgi:hypothetical protein